GFFGARTWQGLVRGAIAQALDRVGRISFDRLGEHVVEWWTDPAVNPHARDPVRFVADFIAPDKTWWRDYAAVLATGQIPAGSDIVHDVRRRLEWEVLAELGYRSQIGRTLERTRVAALGFDREALATAVAAATLRLREDLGPLRDVAPDAVRTLALGFLRHVQRRGGIYHSCLRGYLDQGADSWVFKRLAYLPPFGPRTAAPVFPTGGQRTGNLERLVAPPGQPRTWFQRWSERVLTPQHPLAASTYPAEIWQPVIDALVDAGLLLRAEHRGDPIWAINPERAYVSRQVTVLRCGPSERPLVVPAEEADLWIGTPCLDGAAAGAYAAEPAPPTWFGRLYLTGELHRTVAREHTGLLERDEREALEESFIAGAHPWDPNLLSATPTLEMGIDIGDLSSVFLCSVPPAQANYLQRIGRAGRRDGNALSLTVATGQPHDLYFYAEPEQMMRGRIEAPGVFLNASAVLERQLTAFCLDRWVTSGAREEAIPPVVKAVLDHVEAARLDGFPYPFLDFVKRLGPDLLEAFLGLFGEELSPESRDYLRQFLEGSGEAPGLGPRLVNRLLEVVKERKSIKAQTEALKRRIDGLRAAVQDEATQAEIEDLRQERAGLQAVLRQMNARETMGFLTDEGLIPNYAFPEAGVTLKSVIFRRREQVEDEEQRYETLVFEYERPGAAAIGELAPENDFYAGGRKVRVDQIDMRLSSVEEWRFCPSCSHLERVDTGDHHTLCPRCGDPLWGDAGQRRPMVRLRQVLASTPDRKSRITDDRDDREPVFYTRQMLVGFEPSAVRAAYSVASPDFPFGFEYLARVAFREVNFGEHSASPTTLSVAGLSLPRRGFRICRHCGKVQPAYANQPEHTPICAARNRDAPDAIVDCLYLYREFSSEAIRILLPPTLFAGSDKKLTSFIAALQLGLRRSFGGRVDHLRVMSYEEPLPGSSAKKRFLVLYDTVPGGTGYLKDLVRSDRQLMTVLKQAADVLRDCACNHDPARDGCYSCIYAYRNSYGMQSTSRSAAAAVLAEILSHREDLQPVKTLDQVAVNAAFDSELEARFVEAFKRVRLPGVAVSVRQEVVGGKPGYFLSVGERSYYVEPQVPLGPTDGVAVPSQPDFVIRPARARSDTLPIAVFTDGFEYHRQIVGEDLRKRMAIVLGRQYLQWSLTWHDVEAVLNGGPGDWSDAAPGDDPVRAELRRRMLAALNATALADVASLSSLEILFRYLAAPDPAQWQALAFADALGWFEPAEMLTEAFAGLFHSALASHLPEP
ncbi:MAG: DUF1998 domain-containing protein, partial [Gammaproteobacteria bacterium]|nr:DUF1998 domain-containing protein [Gammaproteobacteria bacterium]